MAKTASLVGLLLLYSKSKVWQKASVTHHLPPSLAFVSTWRWLCVVQFIKPNVSISAAFAYFENGFSARHRECLVTNPIALASILLNRPTAVSSRSAHSARPLSPAVLHPWHLNALFTHLALLCWNVHPRHTAFHFLIMLLLHRFAAHLIRGIELLFTLLTL